MKMTLKRAIMKVGFDVNINIYVDGKFLVSDYNDAFEVFVDKFADVYIYAIEYMYFEGDLTHVRIKISRKEMHK